MAGGKRGAPKGPRPKGWSKELVLSWLKDNPEGKIGRWLDWLCRNLDCKPMVLHKDLRDWKIKDPEFAAAYRAHLLPRGGGQNGRYSLIGAPDVPPAATPEEEPIYAGNDWMERFCSAFLELKSKEAAAQAVGRAFSSIAAYLNPKSADYKPDFDKLWQTTWAIHTACQVAKHEDRLEVAARIAEDVEDARTLAWISLNVLERRDRENWGRREEHHHSGQVDHTVTFQTKHQKALSQALTISQKLFQPAPAAAVPAPDVVEAELVER